MNIEENKVLAKQFIERITTNDLAGALEMVSDGATWWIAGKPDLLPVAGSYDKQRITGLLSNIASQLPDGLRMTIQSLIAEGDRVALEVEGYGELSNGRIYQQQYHFLITIRSGKIAAVKEYLDTQHVYATWFQQ